MIKVRYISCDGVNKLRKYKDIRWARKFAQSMVGKHPDLGTMYAVSDDGIGTIYCSGCTLQELFPDDRN